MDIIKFRAARRKQPKRPLADLGAINGLSKSHLSRLLSGQLDVRLSTVEALAAALGTELMAVPADMAEELRLFIAAKGQLVDADSTAASEAFLERP